MAVFEMQTSLVKVLSLKLLEGKITPDADILSSKKKPLWTLTLSL